MKPKNLIFILLFPTLIFNPGKAQYNLQNLNGKDRPNIENTKQFVIDLKQKANTIIINRLGKFYFDKMNDTAYKYQWYYDNVYFNSAPSEMNYRVFYRFNKESQFQTVFELKFSKDSLKLIDSIEHYLPDCLNTPGECEFISKDRVKNIVKNLFNYKFKGEGNFNFNYDFIFETYVWQYTITTRINSTRGHEGIAVIDANNGKVLSVKTNYDVWMGKCLPANTMILTNNGKTKVQNLKLNDTIITLDEHGNKKNVAISLINVNPVEDDHTLIEITLKDGRIIAASSGHPLADNKTRFGNLKKGMLVDKSPIIRIKKIKYNEGFTYDILCNGFNSVYYANDVLVGSTLFDTYHGKIKK